MAAIYFVGAGPGAPDLISVRGARLLKEADVVIYAGSLVNPELLSLCRAEADIYNSASMDLNEVLQVEADALKQGKMVVRLHTGDPSIYGAIREQMDGLRRLGIEEEAIHVVPGISSFQAAAASLKAEYTLPGVSQTVILTRAGGRTKVPEKEELERLASHQATMCLFLSVQQMEKVIEKLREGGYPEDTPAAVVYRASWPDEKILVGTLADIALQVKEAGLTRQSMIVIGRVLGKAYEHSQLYNPHFSTMFRGKKEKEE
jgi:precorrin-4/cobalt-precorrin-4 C11-methyltransferase